MTIRITVTDLESGDTETREIDNDYVVITAGDRFISHVHAHPNGTHVVTVKRGEGADS